ncbi:hypothetical protein HDF16_005199 [Granulicella aggregans]|uniref:Uncharacterized protein n=1 Tax=Granulicella aggregans TaxID=474949 RepID=A0A7W7ZIP0_9BACT|nr:hypothetical protein [Granulicella aggregans]
MAVEVTSSVKTVIEVPRRSVRLRSFPRRYGNDPVALQDFLKQQPIGRMGRPE